MKKAEREMVNESDENSSSVANTSTPRRAKRQTASKTSEEPPIKKSKSCTSKYNYKEVCVNYTIILFLLIHATHRHKSATFNNLVSPTDLLLSPMTNL